MGVFDTIIIGDDVELPELEGEDGEIWWQTKEVDMPSMTKYKIEDGKLLKHQVEREEKEDEYTEVMGLELPKTEVVDEWWSEYPIHGTFEFHGHNEDHRYSYEARFTKGDLDEIVLLEKKERSDNSTKLDPPKDQ